jgi:drug/metabolite transporter (DMT)-like permease
VTGIGFAFGAMLLIGLADLVYKRGAAAGAPAHQFLMVQTWVFFPTAAAYAWFSGSLPLVAGSLWGTAAGGFMLLGAYLFARSLRTGSISINAPVFRLSFVLTAALAVAVLGEPLPALKVGGIALALAAAWLLLGRAAPDGGRTETRAALAQVIVATVAVGIGNFLYGLGLRAGAPPGSLMAAQASLVCPLATLLAALRDGGIHPSRSALQNAPLAGAALALGSVFMVEAMARVGASIAVPIAQMGFVVSALLGFVFLREGFTPSKGAGIAAALGALACLAHG